MDGHALLTDLQLKGITFAVKGDSISIDDPNRIITPETLAAIRTSKSELLELLRQPTNDPAAYTGTDH